MLLLVDAGNTRIKWALADLRTHARDALDRWAASGVAPRTDAGQLIAAWRNLQRGLQITHVMLSNVAGAAMRDELTQVMQQALEPKPTSIVWFASSAEAGGVRNNYRDPTQLGCDRFASAIGAHALFPDQPLIVATCGTATTIDAVSADGVFQGGMILPGLGLMASSLAKNTAQLPHVAEHILISRPFADNTDDAIVSGCIAAQAGAIERAIAMHQKAQGDAHRVRCIVSGGAAVTIASQLSQPCTQVDNLVLIGLHAVAMQPIPSC